MYPVAVIVWLCAVAQPAPTEWGADHVGKPVPIYEDGNTCLFCHRVTIGPSWQTNRHATTLRAAADEPLAADAIAQCNDATLVLGRNTLRFLKPTGAYGTFALHNGAWNATKFAEKCAGCHTSGFDSVAKVFQTPSLDCHTCHGLAVEEHTTDGALMLLSKKGTTPARVEISICASCHLRGGKSKTTGLPFPNNFVPGDNLFRDFRVDWSDTASEDAHIVETAREMVLNGNEKVTCLSCHSVHEESTAKHRTVAESPLCFACHEERKPMTDVRKSPRNNSTCEY